MASSMNLLVPRARSKDIVGRELDDELLIFDQRSGKAHVLNRTVGAVWKRCDGETSVADVALQLGDELGFPVEEETVWSCLTELGDQGLLEERVSRVPALGLLSRRQMVAGMTAAAITTLVIPTAAAAASPPTCQSQPGGTCNPSLPCCPSTGQTCCNGTCSNLLQNGSSCSNNGQCCSGICTGNPMVCSSCIATGFGTCTSGSQCCSGLCSDGFCVSCMPKNEPCTSGSDCCSGYCKHGKCKGCSPIGDTCEHNGDCCSGRCVNGTCLCTPSGQKPGNDASGVCDAGSADMCCSKTCDGHSGKCK